MVNKIFNLHFTDSCNYHCRFCFVKKRMAVPLMLKETEKVI